MPQADVMLLQMSGSSGKWLGLKSCHLLLHGMCVMGCVSAQPQTWRSDTGTAVTPSEVSESLAVGVNDGRTGHLLSRSW